MTNYTHNTGGESTAQLPLFGAEVVHRVGVVSETLSRRAISRLEELRAAVHAGREAVALVSLRDDARYVERVRKEYHLPVPPGLVLRLKKRQEAEVHTSVEVYSQEVKVRRKRQQTLPSRGGGTRAKIRDFSARSARELLFRARNVEGLTAMLTLTYPGEFPTDGRKVKRDWAAMRRWLGHRKVGGLWWLEFQERGAPHLHVYLTGPVDKEEVAEAWFRIVGSGDRRHRVAGTRIESIRNTHAVGAYAAKYARKQEQKEVPAGYREVGRFWGLFGGVKVVPVVQVESVEEEHQVNGETGESGPSEAVAVVRVVRKLYGANRKARGLRVPRDNGRYGFTAWDIGRAIRRYLERVRAPDNS